MIASFLSRTAAYHDGHHKVSTLNDLPVPEGDWHEKYQQKQSKNNAILAGSILFFVGVVGYVSSYYNAKMLSFGASNTVFLSIFRSTKQESLTSIGRHQALMNRCCEQIVSGLNLVKNKSQV